MFTCEVGLSGALLPPMTNTAQNSNQNRKLVYVQ